VGPRFDAVRGHGFRGEIMEPVSLHPDRVFKQLSGREGLNLTLTLTPTLTPTLTATLTPTLTLTATLTLSSLTPTLTQLSG